MDNFAFDRESTQRIAEAVKKVEAQPVLNGVPPAPFWPGDAINLGIVVCHGKTPEASGSPPDPSDANDLTGPRYHVAPAYCTNDVHDTSDAVLAIAQDTRQGVMPVRTMTNLEELRAGTHKVTNGTPVVWWSVPDTEGAPRFLFITAERFGISTCDNEASEGTGSENEGSEDLGSGSSSGGGCDCATTTKTVVTGVICNGDGTISVTTDTITVFA